VHNLRLRTKIIFWVVVTLTVTQAFYFYLILKDRSEQSFEMTKKASRQLSAVIKGTLEQKMEKNQLEDVEKTTGGCGEDNRNHRKTKRC
jgi:hypothetical protein